MSADIHRTLGEHDAQLEALGRDVSEMKADIKAIRETLSEARGGWKTLLLVGGAAGSMGALIGKFLPFLR